MKTRIKKNKKDADGREIVFLHVETTRNTRGRFRAWCREQGMSMNKALNTLIKIVCSENFHLKSNGHTLSSKQQRKEKA